MTRKIVKRSTFFDPHNHNSLLALISSEELILIIKKKRKIQFILLRLGWSLTHCSLVIDGVRVAREYWETVIPSCACLVTGCELTQCSVVLARYAPTIDGVHVDVSITFMVLILQDKTRDILSSSSIASALQGILYQVACECQNISVHVWRHHWEEKCLCSDANLICLTILPERN